MTSIQEQIWHEIRCSPSIREDLHKGIINVRALAKQFQEKLSVKSLDAIINAIRRFTDEDSFSKVKVAASDILKDAQLSSKNNIASIMLKRTEETVVSIPKLFSEIKMHSQGMFRIVHAHRAMKVYFDVEHLEKVKEYFDKKMILDVSKGLGEVIIDLNNKSWNTPGVFHVLTSELALNKINIVEAITCIPEIVFIVQEKDLMKTYEVLYNLSK